MNYNTFTLPCGLRIIHRPSPSPVVYCGYALGVGTRHEQPGEEGMAHLCEHATFKGTERRRSRQIITCIESVGGDLNAFTNKENTVYHAAILRDNMARAVDLLTDIVFHSTYPQAELEKEIEVICDEIESYNDSPSELIFDDFENIIFAGHPLGHNILGTAEQLRTYTTDDVKRFTAQHYRPENAVFFAYGDIDFKQLVKRLTAAFAFAKDPDSIRCPRTVRSSQDSQNSQSSQCSLSSSLHSLPTSKTIDKSTHQAHVMLGCRAYAIGDKCRMPLYLLNNILGGPGMSARLNLALRERNGLVYTVDSSMVGYADTGLWAIYFGCDPHDIDRCLQLVRRELDRMMLHPLSPAQLTAAKKQIKGQIAVASDARENFALDFAKTYLHSSKEKDINTLFTLIDAVTADEIQSVAQELFAPENLTKLIYK